MLPFIWSIEQGTNIQVIIPTAYKADYEKLIKVNSTYTLSNFQVFPNDLVFKASDNKYKLKWTGGTTAIDANVHDIPLPNMKFKPLAEIIAGKWRADLLVRMSLQFFNIGLNVSYHIYNIMIIWMFLLFRCHRVCSWNWILSSYGWNW